jgi:hypothetical protein
VLSAFFVVHPISEGRNVEVEKEGSAPPPGEHANGWRKVRSRKDRWAFP